MKKLLIACILIYSIHGAAQQSDSIASAISVDASYIGDFVYNVHGGIQQGAAFLGMASLGIMLETNKLGLWKDGTLYIHGKSLHGKSPSANLVGDFQVISNIDGGEHSYLHECWYSQSFQNIHVTVGLQDANVELATSELGSHFINSSFGIPSLIANNVPTPIFPLTNVGVTIKAQLHKKVDVVAALYDGKPTHFDINRYNTDWELQKEDGVLSFVEIQYSSSQSNMYKLGYFNHSGLQEFNDSTRNFEQVFSRNYGLYGIADYILWSNIEQEKSLGIFTQIAASPKSINRHSMYVGGGIVYTGIGVARSVLGLAIAHARFNNKTSETAIEASYKAHIFSNVSIQPDVQYIIYPMGNEKRIPHALAGILRVIVEL